MSRNDEVDLQRVLELAAVAEDDAPTTPEQVDRFSIALARMLRDPAEAGRIDDLIAEVTPAFQQEDEDTRGVAVPWTSARRNRSTTGLDTPPNMPQLIAELYAKVAALQDELEALQAFNRRISASQKDKARQGLAGQSTKQTRRDSARRRVPARFRPSFNPILASALFLVLAAAVASTATGPSALIVTAAGAVSALLSFSVWSLAIWRSANRLSTVDPAAALGILVGNGLAAAGDDPHHEETINHVAGQYLHDDAEAADHADQPLVAPIKEVPSGTQNERAAAYLVPGKSAHRESEGLSKYGAPITHSADPNRPG
jgi:hypothetical protein